MRPLLFIHVPKAAGTSIGHAFCMQERFRKNQVHNELESNYDPAKDITFGHVEIGAVRERHIGEKDWHNYYKFCFVRSPWDRIVSLYEYLKYDGQEFSTFIFNLPNVESVGYYNVKGLSQCRPQVDWIPEDIDYIGKVETLESDIERICQITDREIPEVERTNISKSRKLKHYKEYFPDDFMGESMKRGVEEFYEKDFRRFNYAF